MDLESRRTIAAAPAFLAALAAVALPAFPDGLAAQQAPLKREVPAVQESRCRPPEPTSGLVPGPEGRAEALRNLESAREAAIVGDYGSARDLLLRATRLDPTSPEIAYNLGRALEELGLPRDAAAAYCRFLTLSPASPDADEVRERVARLDPPDVPVTTEAAARFREGLELYDSGDLRAADDAFARTVTLAPRWAEPSFNRAMILMEEGHLEEAAQNLERYLLLRPDAEDRSRVIGWIAALRTPVRGPGPGVALVSGLLVPGLGQFLTDRPLLGLTLMGIAGGGIAVGVLSEERNIQCRIDPTGGVCPPGDILDETVERPFLIPGIAVAAAAALIGAVDAYRSAGRRGNLDALPVRPRSAGVRLDAPALGWDGRGVRAEVLRLRF